MIEILEGVFYDPNKEWYEQEPILIDMGLEIEKTPPIEIDIEVSVAYPTHNRVKYAIWEHTTNMGLFRMRIDMYYLYNIDNNAFLAKTAHNRISLTKIIE